jgi:hypothetical protein
LLDHFFPLLISVCFLLVPCFTCSP